jgi:hypothetical protein
VKIIEGLADCFGLFSTYLERLVMRAGKTLPRAQLGECGSQVLDLFSLVFTKENLVEVHPT